MRINCGSKVDSSILKWHLNVIMDKTQRTCVMSAKKRLQTIQSQMTKSVKPHVKQIFSLCRIICIRLFQLPMTSHD